MGPKPIPFDKLTAERLAASIDIAVSSAEIQENANDLSSRIRAERGVANAVDQVRAFATQICP